MYARVWVSVCLSSLIASTTEHGCFAIESKTTENTNINKWNWWCNVMLCYSIIPMVRGTFGPVCCITQQSINSRMISAPLYLYFQFSTWERQNNFFYLFGFFVFTIRLVHTSLFIYFFLLAFFVFANALGIRQFFFHLPFWQ